MTRKFSDQTKKMSAKDRAEIKTRSKKLLAELPLEQLRSARSLTQTNMAQILGVNQSAISKIEKRTDMYLSTLRSFIQAMGGELEIRAVFPEGCVRINRLGKLDNLRVAQRGEELVGHAFSFPVTVWLGGREVKGRAIASVGVAVAYRGHGIGGALLDAIHEEARASEAANRRCWISSLAIPSSAAQSLIGSSSPSRDLTRSSRPSTSHWSA